jgi:hypothetical protein
MRNLLIALSLAGVTACATAPAAAPSRQLNPVTGGLAGAYLCIYSGVVWFYPGACAATIALGIAIGASAQGWR